MKNLIYVISSILLILLCSCNEEERLSWFVNEIMKNPNRIDSICEAHSGEFISNNKEAYIEMLNNIIESGGYEFAYFNQHKVKYYRNNNYVFWYTYVILNKSKRECFYFDFRKNDGKWELVDIASSLESL